jgi:hypothetical protein
MYMGSAEDEKYDQVLACVMIGPFNTVGNYRFISRLYARFYSIGHQLYVYEAVKPFDYPFAML